ncbi:class I SAM-dependent methyltransferase [Anaeroselena agilis]|uniref:Class I SAM-dependent methyltransferase n=1 Tax=Anaeroselena agilis TaxID=3063788 RepID=A0ABU3NX48_9FIRM|nr:class I SAM-dependent methyltransferase [Selenomonadales bacterium 4137-cl]
MNLIVTTIHKPTPTVAEQAEELAERLAAPFVERGRSSLGSLCAEHDADTVLVAAKGGPVVHTAGGEYFFHLSMAELRINNLKDGKPDHMISAMGLARGMSVLDCTLGLATDAVVASFAAGEEGRVVGLEASPLIAAITGYGLAGFASGRPDVDAALRRIEVIRADYNAYLANLPDASFDVVYFDPMFRAPVAASSSLRPIRTLADPRPVGPEAVAAALRVAKRRVVLKEARGSGEFARLGFATVVGGKYSSIHYGILEAGC